MERTIGKAFHEAAFILLLSVIPAFLFGQSVINLRWKQLGPFTTPVPDVDSGNLTATGVGRIENLFMKAGSERIYAGSNSGGFFRSDNWGRTWKHLPLGDFVVGVNDIDVNPENLDDILIATGNTLLDNHFGYGLLQSKNGGRSWTKTRLNFEPREKEVLVKAKRAQKKKNIWAALSEQKIWMSWDTGRTWERALHSDKFNFKQLLFHPLDDQVIYASGNYLMISYDAGHSWKRVNESLISGDGSGEIQQDINRIAIAVSPQNPDYLYAIYQLQSTNYVRLSRDRGKTWHPISSNTIFGRLDQYHAEICVDPRDSNIIYVGSVWTFVSLDHGKTFRVSSQPVWRSPDFMHDDIRTMIILDDGTVVTGNDGGISLTKDKANTWIDMNGRGLAISQFYSLAVQPGKKRILLAGTQDMSSMIYRKGRWTHVSRIYGDGGPCLIWGKAGENWMISQNSYLHNSQTQGANWLPIGNPEVTNKYFFPLIEDPSEPGTIYAGWHHLWKKEGEKWWTNVSEKVDGKQFAVNTVSIVTLPDSSKVFYMAIDQPAWQTGALLKNKLFRGILRDGKIEWVDISGRLPILAWRHITDLVTKPGDSSQIWVCLEGFDDKGDNHRVYYSDDGGQNWNNISEGLPNMGAQRMIYGGGKDQIWLGTHTGLYYRNKAMNIWAKVGKNLPALMIRDLDFSSNGKHLYVTSYGNGIWVGKLKRKYRM